MRNLVESRGAFAIGDTEPPGIDVDEAAQIAHLAELIGEPNEHTYIVSISMGNHITMRYLQTLAVQGKRLVCWLTMSCWFSAAIFKGKGDFGPSGAPPGVFGDMGDFTTVDGAAVYAAISSNHRMVQVCIIRSFVLRESSYCRHNVAVILMLPYLTRVPAIQLYSSTRSTICSFGATSSASS
eukprot:SAG31_NODE_8064_length_1530_cov_0.995108_1_plen_182_part_00